MSFGLISQVKEQQIKKQFHDTVKVQTRQYKVLQRQMVSTMPKEKHREVLRQKKEEQMRRMAVLATQYERTIADMLQQQTVHEVDRQYLMVILLVSLCRLN